jgi:small subunit ribosomal protein S4
MKRGKLSEYGVRLREKQELNRFYGILERPFRRVFELASRSTSNTGEVLLVLMERRLDNIIHRLGFAMSRAAARQMVTHGHIQVNGRRCNIPSFLVKANDVITVRDRKESREMAKLSFSQNPPSVPDYLQRTSEEPPEGKVLRLPSRDDVDPRIKHINEQLIIEISTR